MDHEIIDLLNKIKCCVDDSELRMKCGFIPLGSSKKMIFKGCSDVWETNENGPIHDKFMSDKLNRARDLGLIKNESGQSVWSNDENWFLTSTGERYYGQRNRANIEEDEG